MKDADFERKTITPQSDNMILKGYYTKSARNIQFKHQPNSMEIQENQTKKIIEREIKAYLDSIKI